jgi:hypothetical protein
MPHWRARIDARLKKLKSLLARNDRACEDLRPPEGSVLTIADVKALRRGKVKYIWVVEPQHYDCVTKLTLKHDMFTDAGDANDYPYGLFHDNNETSMYHKKLRGAARSAVAGYIWWKVNTRKTTATNKTRLEEFIDKKIKKLRKK